MAKNNHSDWLKWHSIFFYISAILLVITWFIFQSPRTVKVITAVCFVIFQAIFNIKNMYVTKFLFNKVIYWSGFIIMLIATVMYIAISVGEVTIAFWVLVSSFLIIIIGTIILYINRVLKSDTLRWVIFSYIVVSFLVILLFGFIFTFLEGFGIGSLVVSGSPEKIGSFYEDLYFSSSAYYSNSIGDIQPTGYSRLFMQIESALSRLLHVVIIGFVISSFDKGKKRTKPF